MSLPAEPCWGCLVCGFMSGWNGVDGARRAVHGAAYACDLVSSEVGHIFVVRHYISTVLHACTSHP